MDVQDTPEEAAFRAEVRSWLDGNAAPRGSSDDWSRDFWDPSADWDDLVQRSRDWHRLLADAGWAGIMVPTEYGGRGGSAMEELIFAQESADFGVSAGAFAVAQTMVAPAILAFGTEEQRRRHVPALLDGRELWCQLFSEPGSGSDLASLRTKATLDGDEWIVEGQKVWTTYADSCDWGILLARTDPDAPRHRGITYFLLDMRTPGIDVRPLRQITGQTHFNEVFLTDVRIPKENVLGGSAHVNDGWRAAMHTLTNERAMIGSASSDDDIQGLIELARVHGVIDDPRIRQGIADTHLRSEILRFHGYRLQTAISNGRAPGPESSVVKLFYGDHLRKLTNLALEIQGAGGMLASTDAGAGSEGWPGWFHLRFLYAPSLSIAGGTSEVQRGIIGDRVLGLPAEPRPGDGVPDGAKGSR